MIVSWDWKKPQHHTEEGAKKAGRLWQVPCLWVRAALEAQNLWCVTQQRELWGQGRGRGAKAERLSGKKRDLREKCLWREMAHFCSAGKAQEELGSWPSFSPTRPPSIGKWWLSRRGPWWSHLAALMLRGSDLQPWNWGALAKAAVTTQSAICQGHEG